MNRVTSCTQKEKAFWEPLIGTNVGNHLDVDKIANNVFTLGDTINHFNLRGEVLHATKITMKDFLEKHQ